MPRDSVSRIANVGSVGTNGLKSISLARSSKTCFFMKRLKQSKQTYIFITYLKHFNKHLKSFKQTDILLNRLQQYKQIYIL